MKLISERMLDEISGHSRWVKGAWEREAGGRCLVGTFSFLMTGDARYHIGRGIHHPYMARLAEVIREQFPERVSDAYSDDKSVVMYFNDHLKTVFPDIRLVLEKAVTW